MSHNLVAFRTLLSPIISKSDYELHEESWNAYPYCRTVITNPSYMKDSFKVVLETMHLTDTGNHPNPLQKPYKVPSEVVDITEPKSKELPPDLGQPSAHVARLSPTRGPLRGRGWVAKAHPVMTCYKQVTVICQWGWLTNKLEREIMKYYREVLLACHQKIWLDIAKWMPMSMEQIRLMERQLQQRTA